MIFTKTNLHLSARPLAIILLWAHAAVGDIISQNVSIQTKAFSNDSQVTGGKKIDVYASESLSGTGSFEAPLIEIKTRKFEFTGTIRCSGTCTIIAEAPFDQSMFKREGGGTFNISIAPFQEISFEHKMPKIPNMEELFPHRFKPTPASERFGREEQRTVKPSITPFQENGFVNKQQKKPSAEDASRNFAPESTPSAHAFKQPEESIEQKLARYQEEGLIPKKLNMEELFPHRFKPTPASERFGREGRGTANPPLALHQEPSREHKSPHVVVEDPKAAVPRNFAPQSTPATPVFKYSEESMEQKLVRYQKEGRIKKSGDTIAFTLQREDAATLEAAGLGGLATLIFAAMTYKAFTSPQPKTWEKILSLSVTSLTALGTLAAILTRLHNRSSHPETIVLESDGVSVRNGFFHSQNSKIPWANLTLIPKTGSLLLRDGNRQVEVATRDLPFEGFDNKILAQAIDLINFIRQQGEQTDSQTTNPA